MIDSAYLAFRASPISIRLICTDKEGQQRKRGKPVASLDPSFELTVNLHRSLVVIRLCNSINVSRFRARSKPVRIQRFVRSRASCCFYASGVQANPDSLLTSSRYRLEWIMIIHGRATDRAPSQLAKIHRVHYESGCSRGENLTRTNGERRDSSVLK